MFLQIIVSFLVIWLLIIKWNRRHLEKLAGQLKTKLRSYPIVGHSYLLLGNDEDTMKLFQLLGRDAIESGGTTALWQAHKLYLMIADPEVADKVLKNCLEKDDIYNVFHKVTGDGSVFSSVSKWRPRRKFMAPIFNMKNLNCFVEEFSAKSCVLVDQLKRVAGKGPTSMWNVLSSYTMDAIFGTTLGVQFNAQENSKQSLLVAMEEILQIISRRACQPWLHSDFIFNLLPQNRTVLKQKSLVEESLSKIIGQKRKANEKHQQHKEIQSDGLKPFVELMLESDLGLSDVTIREECIVIIGAGTDTSAVGMGYTFLMLARYPEVQEKVYEEIKYVIGDTDSPVMAADLHRFKYLDAVIRETMRLFPPIPIIIRKIDKDIKLPSGVTLLPGCGAVVNIWAIHRNPHYWGEDAEQFRPERFLDYAPKHPAAFMPFSSGPRNCIGYQYAMMSMKTVLATLLLRYRIVPAPGDELKHEPLRVKYDIMMRHVDNYCVGIEIRK